MFSDFLLDCLAVHQSVLLSGSVSPVLSGINNWFMRGSTTFSTSTTWKLLCHRSVHCVPGQRQHPPTPKKHPWLCKSCQTQLTIAQFPWTQTQAESHHEDDLRRWIRKKGGIKWLKVMYSTVPNTIKAFQNWMHCNITLLSIRKWWHEEIENLSTLVKLVILQLHCSFCAHFKHACRFAIFLKLFVGKCSYSVSRRTPADAVTHWSYVISPL